MYNFLSSCFQVRVTWNQQYLCFIFLNTSGIAIFIAWSSSEKISTNIQQITPIEPHNLTICSPFLFIRKHSPVSRTCGSCPCIHVLNIVNNQQMIPLIHLSIMLAQTQYFVADSLIQHTLLMTSYAYSSYELCRT
jgi:hypothetical protein